MEKCLRQRDCKRNVHDVALVGGSTRTETVLPMNWKGRTIHWRDVEEQTCVPSRSGELLMKLPGSANVTLDAES